MSGFDPRDPDVVALMHARALAQGRAHNAQTILGTRVHTPTGLSLVDAFILSQPTLPKFTAPRGGIRYPPPQPLAGA